MKHIQQQFFDLLRAGLWGTEPDESLFRGETDWKVLMRMSQMQTVIGLTGDGVARLPKDVQPDKATINWFYVWRVRIRQAHQLLDSTLAEVVSLLKREGIPAILLKGQGVAQNYIRPEARTCGDIDLYVGEKEYDKACRLVGSFGDCSGQESESDKHYHFSRNGIDIEIHRYAETQFSPLQNRRFQEWTLKHLRGGQLRAWRTGGEDIALPPVQFDPLYILNHLMHHFLTGGVGLRQLCDWARYLHTFRRGIDRKQLKADLERFRMMRVWQTFGCLAVEVLGLPEEEMPFYTSAYRTRALRVLEMIMESGNFGKYDRQRQHRVTPAFYLLRKLHSYRQTLGRQLRLVLLFPADSLSFTWWHTLKGTARVLMHK